MKAKETKVRLRKLEQRNLGQCSPCSRADIGEPDV